MKNSKIIKRHILAMQHDLERERNKKMKSKKGNVWIVLGIISISIAVLSSIAVSLYFCSKNKKSNKILVGNDSDEYAAADAEPFPVNGHQDDDADDIVQFETMNSSSENSNKIEENGSTTACTDAEVSPKSEN